MLFVKMLVFTHSILVANRTFEPLAKLFFAVILNEVKDLNRLKIRDSSLHSE
jgi:hypothetical protein